MSTEIATINSIRENAKAFLQTHKFPSNSDESFRFSSLRKYFTEHVEPYEGSIADVMAEDVLKSLPKYYRETRNHTNFLILNGSLQSPFNENVPITIEVNAEIAEMQYAGNAIVEPNYFTEQNGANFPNLFSLEIKEATERPINIFVINTHPDFTLPRILIVGRKSSEATVNVIFSSLQDWDKMYVNSVTEVFLEENAQLNFNLIEKDNANLVLMNTIEAVCERNACFYLNSYIKGSLFVRNNIHARLTGKNAYASLTGFYNTAGNELADNHILIDHQVPDCESNQFYKGLLNDESTGVFNGRIMVHQDAQRTNAYQSSKAVLLSDNATIHSMPQLEIFADDVKCSHGAAIGQLNKDELFYFKARGVDEATAKSILNFAYSREVLNKINDISLRDYLIAEQKAENDLDFED